MPVPTRREAARLLRSLDPAPWSVRHACAVADVAAWLARAAIRNGHALDAGSIETAALLHVSTAHADRDNPLIPGARRSSPVSREATRGTAAEATARRIEDSILEGSLRPGD